eukprot:10919601-Ditylum_brightwellii.AAC.1
MAVLSDRALPSFTNTVMANQHMEDIAKIVLTLQSKGEKEMNSVVADMQAFNGKTDMPKFQAIGDAATAVLDN